MNSTYVGNSHLFSISGAVASQSPQLGSQVLTKLPLPWQPAAASEMPRHLALLTLGQFGDFDLSVAVSAAALRVCQQLRWLR